MAVGSALRLAWESRVSGVGRPRIRGARRWVLRRWEARPGGGTRRGRPAPRGFSGTGDASTSREKEESRRVKQLNRASELLQTIIDEVSREHFIDTAALIIEDDEADGLGDASGKGTEALAQVARKVCRVYMDELDSVFLATLLAYIQAAKDQNREDVVELLNCVYEQIILLLRMDLPGGIQCVDILTQVVGQADRERVLMKALGEAERNRDEGTPLDGSDAEAGRVAAAGESALDKLEVPACKPSEVFGACQEMLRQMETQDAFDKLLYYRVCCVREEVRDFAERFEAGETSIARAYPHALPARELALVKELLRVQGEQRIRALLSRAIAEFDVLQAEVDFGDVERGSASGLHGQMDGTNVIPHKLMECLAALLHESEMEDNDRMRGRDLPPEEVVKQMRLVREQAVSVLRQLAQMDSA